MAKDKDYLAMYLQIQTEFNKPPHFTPIMHFAETTTRLLADIKDNLFYKNEIVAGMACERIKNKSPFGISVLFSSTMPEIANLFKRKKARDEFKKLEEDLNAFMHPPQTAPFIMPNEISHVKIAMGMKNRNTPYPQDFVTHDNFTSGRFLIEFSHSQAKLKPFLVDNGLMFVLEFFAITGQKFMLTDD